ncbi:hypothetical protein BD770DRAFT_394709 [Pilaira anomala]|nr:hypothetical protein BD770DRAFT_394709 [Pilaira anomala]
MVKLEWCFKEASLVSYIRILIISCSIMFYLFVHLSIVTICNTYLSCHQFIFIDH